MKCKKIGVILSMVAVLALMTACGDKTEETKEPIATEVASGTAVAEVTDTPATEEAASQETTGPETVDEEAAADEAQTFDEDELKMLLERCIGISGTAGASLKIQQAAVECLGYAVEYHLSELGDTELSNLSKSFKNAYLKLSKAQRIEFKHTFEEEIMPVILDTFQDPSAYRDEWKDAGVESNWKTLLEEPTVRADWKIFWGMFEGTI